MINKLFFTIACLVFAALSPLATMEAAEATEATTKSNCVVLLHGLGRTPASMIRMESKLEEAGFAVVSQPYPSRDQAVQQLAGNAVGNGIEACEEYSPDKIHFVTHSLGGILVRFYFINELHPKLGRVVMLAPPNKGSEIIDVMDSVPGFNFITGPSGSQLGTGNGSMPRFLGMVNFDLGVIAGNQSYNPFYSLMIPGPDDGKVSVTSTHLEGENQHLVLPVTHTFMMYNIEVINQVINFLKTGKFLDKLE